MTSSIHPVRRRRSRKGSKDDEVSIAQDFGPYQVCLLAATQFSYWPVAGSILFPSFMKMTKESCELVLAARNGSMSGNGTGAVDQTTTPRLDGEFTSLLRLWDVDCTEQGHWIQTGITEMIMFGGLIGACAAGFIADRYGRKPVVIASLILIALSNAALLLASLFASPWPTLPVFLVLGGACGGYMVTNLTLLVESLCLPSSRLLVVALNGWSWCMALTALLAFLWPNWFHYHLALALIAAGCALALHFIADESLRWLKNSQKVTRFDEASARLVRFNGGENCKDIALLCQLEKDGEGQVQREQEEALPARSPMIGGAGRIEMDEEGGQPALAAAPSMSYIDLLKERSLRPRLLSLAYCFFCTSIVSFGCYFAMDSLMGNRYLVMASAGMLKFFAGLIPFAVSSCCSRKKVALVSGAVVVALLWAAFACIVAGLSLQSITITILCVSAVAMLDPTWKVAHLYSTELFPTSMRNMARGFCQSAARVGSALTPLIAHYRHDFAYVLFGIFAVLMTAQFAITMIFLPDQPPSELQDAIAPSIVAAEREVEKRQKKKQKRSEYEEREEDEESRSRDSSQLSETAPLTP